MNNRRKTALAVRLYVDAHDLTHWEVYERASGAVLFRTRTAPKRGYAQHNKLAHILRDLQAVAE